MIASIPIPPPRAHPHGRQPEPSGWTRASQTSRACRVDGAREAWSPDCSCSSNWGEVRGLDLAPARSRERQRRGACWPSRVTRSASTIVVAMSVGVAPEFMPVKAQLRADRQRRPDHRRPWRVPRLANTRTRGASLGRPDCWQRRCAGSRVGTLPARSPIPRRESRGCRGGPRRASSLRPPVRSA